MFKPILVPPPPIEPLESRGSKRTPRIQGYLESHELNWYREVRPHELSAISTRREKIKTKSLDTQWKLVEAIKTFFSRLKLKMGIYRRPLSTETQMDRSIKGFVSSILRTTSRSSTQKISKITRSKSRGVGESTKTPKGEEGLKPLSMPTHSDTHEAKGSTPVTKFN